MYTTLVHFCSNLFCSYIKSWYKHAGLSSVAALLGFIPIALCSVDGAVKTRTMLTNKLGLAWLLPWLDVELLFIPTLFWQIRESMYQSLGLMSTSVAAFYACGAGQRLWGSGLMDHVEYMDHQHLRMLLRHLMLSFTRVCPPQHRYSPIPCSVLCVIHDSITSSIESWLYVE